MAFVHTIGRLKIQMFYEGVEVGTGAGSGAIIQCRDRLKENDCHSVVTDSWKGMAGPAVS